MWDDASNGDLAILDAQIAALVVAASQGDVQTARALLDTNPALLNATDAEGRTAMTCAIYAGQPAIVALLRERGAEPTIFEAAALGDIPAIQAALARGPDVLRAYSFDGWTALHLAAHYGQIDAARALLAAGANISAHSWNGLDNEPIHAAAAQKGNTLMVAALLDAGAQVNARQHGGYTPLHAAAQNGDGEMVTLLLARGARKALLTDRDQSAADLADAAGHPELAVRLS